MRLKLRLLGDERGSALVLFAFGLTGLMGLVGMSIDIGSLVFTRTDLQKDADAAALAGAQDLDGTSAGATTAKASADAYLVKNGLGSAPCRPNCASVNGSYDTVTVTVTKAIQYNFLKIVGIDGATPAATGAAKASKKLVTGYDWNSVAPFTLWGGSRTTEIHPSDANCPLHVCVGSTYTFLDTSWMGVNGTPKAPDWTALGNGNGNGFKGDIGHGQGGVIVQVGDSFTTTTHPGFGNVVAPAVGSTIVIPVLSKASGNGTLTLTIAAWVEVLVNPGCKKQHCDGVVLGPAVAPSGWSTSGSVQPPATLAQFISNGGLIQ